MGGCYPYRGTHPPYTKLVNKLNEVNVNYLAVLLVAVVLAQVDLGPGESTTVTCPTFITGTINPNIVDLNCELEPTATPTNTPTVTNTLTNTTVPTVTNTPLPPATVVLTSTFTPTPTNTPTTIPTATVAPVGLVVGNGVGEYRTIDAAMTAATAGSTIRIRAGIYATEVVVTKSLTFVAYGDGQVTIDGSCSRPHAFRFSSSAGNGSIVRGLQLRNTVESTVLIENTNVKNITIDSNTITDFDCDNSGPENQAGVAVWYGGSGQKITNNTIKRRSSGSLDNGQSDCVWFKSNSANRSGGLHTISNNVLSGCWDGIGGEVEDDIHGSFDGNTLIEANHVINCNDDGIQVEGGTTGVVVRDNTIEGCAIGIANAPNLSGPSNFIGNTITNGKVGWAGNIACFKIGDNGTGLAYYTNNKCVLTQSIAAGWAQTNPGNNKIISRGNVIRVGDYVIEFTGSVAAQTSFDTDCLWTTSTTKFAKWNGNQVSFAGLRSLGQELNGTSNNQCGL